MESEKTHKMSCQSDTAHRIDRGAGTSGSAKWMWCADNQNVPICVRGGVSPAVGVCREEAAGGSDAY